VGSGPVAFIATSVLQVVVAVPLLVLSYADRAHARDGSADLDRRHLMRSAAG
jgi:hypothetical protein